MARPKQIDERKLLSYLKDGWNASRIAKQLGFSAVSVGKHLLALRKAGIIERNAGFPKTYSIISPEREAKVKANVGDDGLNQEATIDNPLRPAEPHSWGQEYSLEGVVLGGRKSRRPMRGGWFVRTWKEREFTIICRKKSVVFWLKAFKGITDEEIVRNGEEAIRNRARLFGLQESVRLSFLRTVQLRHWATVPVNAGLSKMLIEGAGLREKGFEGVQIEGARLFEDSSHKGRAESVVTGKDSTGIDWEQDEFVRRLRMAMRDAPALAGVPNKVKSIEEGTIEAVSKIELRLKALEEPKLEELKSSIKFDGERREVF